MFFNYLFSFYILDSIKIILKIIMFIVFSNNYFFNKYTLCYFSSFKHGEKYIFQHDYQHITPIFLWIPIYRIHYYYYWEIEYVIIKLQKYSENHIIKKFCLIYTNYQRTLGFYIFSILVYKIHKLHMHFGFNMP